MSRRIEIVSKHEHMLADSSYKAPKRATRGSAGYDFFNLTGESIIIKPGETSKPIPLFHKVKMNFDEVFELYPRSSFGFKKSTVLVNTVGIIDSDYYNNADNEGEIFVKFINHGIEDMVIEQGTALVQGIFKKYLLTEDDISIGGGVRKGGIGSTN